MAPATRAVTVRGVRPAHRMRIIGWALVLSISATATAAAAAAAAARTTRMADAVAPVMAAIQRDSVVVVEKRSVEAS